jgi:hypothetical protein
MNAQVSNCVKITRDFEKDKVDVLILFLYLV